ncbi:uncharacterized protein [Battus philenor]|uniref:uncharacterized protein n=1 Tax=Battus philenor TaxID=42288 RepID=UPI0035CF1C3F
MSSITNAFQSESHVNIILNIQRLQKSLKLVTISYRGLIFVNWIYVLDKRSVYKTLSRASRVASNVISADSGIFTVDATLPLSLISVVATYSIVLLQFAFL